MSPMMAPSMIDLLDTLRRAEAIRCSFPAGRRLSRNDALQRKEKGTGCGRRDKDPARAACPGTKIPIPPRQDMGHYHASMIRPVRNGRPFRLRALFPCRALPQVADWPKGRNLSVFPLAAEMVTAVGHGRFGRTKGAPGRTAGAALASGAYHMSVATNIAANITFRYRSRKTADEALRHGLPHRSGVTLSRSECLILLQDRSRL